MPDQFKPDQYAVRYTTMEGVVLTLGNYDDQGRALSLSILLNEKNPEAGAVVVHRTITPWEAVDAAA